MTSISPTMMHPSQIDAGDDNTAQPFFFGMEALGFRTTEDGGFPWYFQQPGLQFALPQMPPALSAPQQLLHNAYQNNPFLAAPMLIDPTPQMFFELPQQVDADELSVSSDVTQDHYDIDSTTSSPSNTLGGKRKKKARQVQVVYQEPIEVSTAVQLSGETVVEAAKYRERNREACRANRQKQKEKMQLLEQKVRDLERRHKTLLRCVEKATSVAIPKEYLAVYTPDELQSFHRRIVEDFFASKNQNLLERSSPHIHPSCSLLHMDSNISFNGKPALWLSWVSCKRRYVYVRWQVTSVEPLTEKGEHIRIKSTFKGLVRGKFTSLEDYTDTIADDSNKILEKMSLYSKCASDMEFMKLTGTIEPVEALGFTEVEGNCTNIISFGSDHRINFIGTGLDASSVKLMEPQGGEEVISP